MKTETITQLMVDKIEELELKLSSAHEHIKRLQEAGDRLVPMASAVNMWKHITAWDKAKRNEDIEDINDKTTMEQNFYVQKPIDSGLACPKCCGDLYFDKPNAVYATCPPKRSVKCNKCEYSDYVHAHLMIPVIKL